MKREVEIQVVFVGLMVLGMIIGIVIGQGLTVLNARVVNENCIEFFGKPHYYED